MKKILFTLFFIPFLASAETCFTRNEQIQTNQISLPSEFCFATPELELNYFEDSYALLRYTIDGKRAFNKARLKGKFNSAGFYEVNVVIASDSSGNICDESFEADVVLTMEISRDGSTVKLSKMNGEVRYTYDQCHDQFDTIQNLTFSKFEVL